VGLSHKFPILQFTPDELSGVATRHNEARACQKMSRFSLSDILWPAVWCSFFVRAPV